jgi:hypothetical protein
MTSPTVNVFIHITHSRSTRSLRSLQLYFSDSASKYDFIVRKYLTSPVVQTLVTSLYWSIKPSLINFRSAKASRLMDNTCSCCLQQAMATWIRHKHLEPYQRNWPMHVNYSSIAHLDLSIGNNLRYDSTWPFPTWKLLLDNSHSAWWTCFGFWIRHAF